MLNKGAMFVLNVIIKRRRHPELVSGSHKRAAMFGLDARIALAIFGALSVISGAALYSAIQEARLTAFHTEVLEIGKAWEQYYLDTGQDMPINADFYRNSSKLVDDSVAGWKGPYLNYQKGAVPHDYVLIMNDDGGYIYIHTCNDNAWGHAPTGGECTAGQSCYVWIGMKRNNAQTQELAKQLDIKLDGAASFTTGDVRYDTTYDIFYLKYAPIKNPN